MGNNNQQTFSMRCVLRICVVLYFVWKDGAHAGFFILKTSSPTNNIVEHGVDYNDYDNNMNSNNTASTKRKKKGKDYYDPLDDPEWYDQKDAEKEEKYVQAQMDKNRRARHGGKKKSRKRG